MWKLNFCNIDPHFQIQNYGKNGWMTFFPSIFEDKLPQRNWNFKGFSFYENRNGLSYLPKCVHKRHLTILFAMLSISILKEFLAVRICVGGLFLEDIYRKEEVWRNERRVNSTISHVFLAVNLFTTVAPGKNFCVENEREACLLLFFSFSVSPRRKVQDIG